METQISEHAATGIELKNQIRAKQIMDLLAQGHTFTQIAKQIGIGRTQLYAVMSQTNVQQLMRAELNELKTHLQELLYQLEQSPSPQDKRTAAQELGKMQRHLEDKLTPYLTANLNINATLNLNQLNQELQRHNQTLAALPPTHRQLYWQTYNQLHPNNQQTT